MALSTVRVPKQFTSWITHTGPRSSGIQPLPGTVKSLPRGPSSRPLFWYLGGKPSAPVWKPQSLARTDVGDTAAPLWAGEIAQWLRMLRGLNLRSDTGSR